MLLTFQTILILLLCGTSYAISELSHSAFKFDLCSVGDGELLPNPMVTSLEMEKDDSKRVVATTTFASSAMSNLISNKKTSLPTVLGRVPRAVISSIKVAVSAQISFCKVSIPLALVMNARDLGTTPLSQWALGGLKTGLEWSQFTALQRGSQRLLEVLRNKNDRANIYIGAGLANSVVGYPKPLSMGYAFVRGFTLMAAIDQTMKAIGGTTPGIVYDSSLPAAADAAPITSVKPVFFSSSTSSSSSSSPTSCDDTLHGESSDSQGFAMFMMDNSFGRRMSSTASSTTPKVKQVSLKGGIHRMLGK